MSAPITEDERMITYMLHKQQRFGLPDALQRLRSCFAAAALPLNIDALGDQLQIDGLVRFEQAFDRILSSVR